MTCDVLEAGLKWPFEELHFSLAVISPHRVAGRLSEQERRWCPGRRSDWIVSAAVTPQRSRWRRRQTSTRLLPSLPSR